MGKGRRAKARKELIDHILDRQIRPQQVAQELREQGMNAETRFVSTNPTAQGVEVTCQGCGRTARLLAPIPEGMVAMCPNCVGPGSG